MGPLREIFVGGDTVECPDGTIVHSDYIHPELAVESESEDAKDPESTEGLIGV